MAHSIYKRSHLSWLNHNQRLQEQTWQSLLVHFSSGTHTAEEQEEDRTLQDLGTGEISAWNLNNLSVLMCSKQGWWYAKGEHRVWTAQQEESHFFKSCTLRQRWDTVHRTPVWSSAPVLETEAVPLCQSDLDPGRNRPLPSKWNCFSQPSAGQSVYRGAGSRVAHDGAALAQSMRQWWRHVQCRARAGKLTPVNYSDWRYLSLKWELIFLVSHNCSLLCL